MSSADLQAICNQLARNIYLSRTFHAICTTKDRILSHVYPIKIPTVRLHYQDEKSTGTRDSGSLQTQVETESL